MSYKTYESYKDSGIIWANEIPNHWVINKLKRIFLFEKGRNAQSYTAEYINSTEGFFPVYSGQTKNDGILGYINTFEYDFDNNVILVTTVGAKAMTTFRINGKLSLSQNCALIKLKSNEDISDYYYYLCKILFNYERELIPDIMQPSLRIGDLNTYNILQPPNDEQLKIANYLDKKTSEIDENIAKNKELISLLEEKKTALINQVVTKGLDPNVPMKDSNVNWAKNIPYHWDVVLAKRFCKIETGGTPKRENLSFWENGTINWMTSGEVNQEIITETNSKITEEGLNNSNAHILPKKAIVMALSGQGQTKGRVAVLDIETCCSQSVGAFVCDNKNIYFKYLFYYLKSRYYEIRGLVGDNLRDGLSLSIIGNILVLIPPFEEQIIISKFLDDNIPKIDKTIEKIQENINLLEEYKTSLIHHAVTGKIDVRDEI